MAQTHLEEIRQRQEAAGGLLTEKAAARVVEAQKISGIREGEAPNITARVDRVFATHKFSKNGREGTVRRVAVSDSSGTTTLVLWGIQGALIEPFEKGDFVKLSGFTAKKTGQLELHSTNSSKISEAKGTRLLGLSPLPGKETAIGELKEGEEADFFARIKQVGAKRAFEKNNSKGVVARCTAEDAAGAVVPLVLWDSNADAADSLKEGTVIKVECGRPRLNNGILEVHVHESGRIILKPRSAPQRLTRLASA